MTELIIEEGIVIDDVCCALSEIRKLRRDGKYSAIIMRACPHKTAGGAGYSSAVEKFKQFGGMPYTIDARTHSGELKLTGESFRNALLKVYNYLKMAA